MRGPIARVRGIMHPEAFHGHGEKPPYFEGWYIKLVSADRTQRWAFIPGVFLGANGEHEAFVQVLNGGTGEATYVKFDVSAFNASAETFSAAVGVNTFSTTGVHLELPELQLNGDIRFGTPMQPWPVSALHPGIMDWYAWVPFMECYHGIVSFGHDLEGSITVGGERIDFTGGRGYIEKDWGQAFPAGYVWMHSNHFEGVADASLIASVAIIPWVRSAFRGFIVGLYAGGKLYRWATYNGAKERELSITDSHVSWSMVGPDGTLRLEADRVRGGLLKAPMRTQMHKRVEETLDATIHVTLVDTNGTTIVDTTATCGGMEVVGDLGRLLAINTR